MARTGPAVTVAARLLVGAKRTCRLRAPTSENNSERTCALKVSPRPVLLDHSAQRSDKVCYILPWFLRGPGQLGGLHEAARVHCFTRWCGSVAFFRLWRNRRGHGGSVHFSTVILKATRRWQRSVAV